MSSLKTEWPWHSAPALHPVSETARLLAAILLRAASASLARGAAALIAPAATAPARPRSEARIEFRAHGGGPDGALYLDGELVGRLPGVARL